MTQTFNKVRYIELLKKDQSLESQNSSLYKEDRIEYRELLSYGIILENQILYNRRHDYISLIEKYVTNEIDSFILRWKFFQIEREDKKIQKDLEKNFEQLFNVSIDSKSAEFSTLLEDIAAACEFFDWTDETDERKFRPYVEKTFLQMKQYKDSQKVPMDDSFEILRQVPEPCIRLILISLLLSGTALLTC